MENQSKGNLNAALESLLAEEISLKGELAFLQSRLSKLGAAITAIRALMEGNEEFGLLAQQLSRLGATQPEVEFLGMPISQAILHFMRQRSEAMLAVEIANEMRKAGYKSDSTDFANLVGSTLRRMKADGKVEQNEDRKWIAAPSGLVRDMVTGHFISASAPSRQL